MVKLCQSKYIACISYAAKKLVNISPRKSLPFYAIIACFSKCIYNEKFIPEQVRFSFYLHESNNKKNIF